MRIISQNGKKDIPYDRFIFYQSNCLIYYTEGIEKELECIAAYSTQEQATSALELLHKEYQRTKEWEATGDCIMQPSYIFQFPQDEVQR